MGRVHPAKGSGEANSGLRRMGDGKAAQLKRPSDITVLSIQISLARAQKGSLCNEFSGEVRIPVY